MNAEQFFNNGFGADVEKVHRKHVIDLMTNFAKHYHTEQCNIADVVGRSEQLVCQESELDCPYDFTSRCTLGRCNCKPKAS